MSIAAFIVILVARTVENTIICASFRNIIWTCRKTFIFQLATYFYFFQKRTCRVTKLVIQYCSISYRISSIPISSTTARNHAIETATYILHKRTIWDTNLIIIEPFLVTIGSVTCSIHVKNLCAFRKTKIHIFDSMNCPHRWELITFGFTDVTFRLINIIFFCTFRHASFVFKINEIRATRETLFSNWILIWKRAGTRIHAIYNRCLSIMKWTISLRHTYFTRSI